MAVESVETALKSESGFMGVNRRADKAGQVLHRQKLGSLVVAGCGVGYTGSSWAVVVLLSGYVLCFFFISINPSIHQRQFGVAGFPRRNSEAETGHVWLNCVGCGGSEWLPSPWSFWLFVDWLGGLGWLCHLPTCPVLLFQRRFVFLRMLHGAWPSFPGEDRPPIWIRPLFSCLGRGKGPSESLIWRCFSSFRVLVGWENRDYGG